MTTTGTTETLTRMADDIYQLQLPLPFALRIVNVYLLRGPAGWTVVDTGINWAEGRAAWKAALTQLDIRPQQIERILLTHVHPDHYGMGGWLQALAAGHDHHIPVYASPREIELARLIWGGESDVEFEGWLRHLGMPVDFARDVAGSMGNTAAMTLPHPPQMLPIEPDAVVTLGERSYRAIHSPGHSDGHLMFHDANEQLLLSGDHVLMKITPNIGMWTMTQGNPLVSFMASLEALRSLSVRVALPGHKWTITDWQGRIDELLAHHHHRLGVAQQAVADGAHTPFQVTERIFNTDRFTVHEWRFAMAESLAHMAYLQAHDRIVLQNDETGYRAASP